MPHSRFSSGEIGRPGDELYEQHIRAQVATEENIGKLLSIDVETGDYEIGDDRSLDAPRRLLADSQLLTQFVESGLVTVEDLLQP